MTTPTPDLLYIAGVVYPGIRKLVDDGVVYIYEYAEYRPFDPKLDGTDRERAQALDCIVAANKNHHEGFITRLALGDDELSAALLALMELKK
jgi:hypothetical protein